MEGKKPLYSAKDVVLSFQHMFAMLGATVLVPMLANMSISLALIAAGVGTICFYFITKRKVPVFLGSSFAFLPALAAIIGTDKSKYSAEWNHAMLYAAIGLVLAGLVYVILSVVIKYVGVKKIKKLFPPIVVGPVIIVIGMILAPKMFYNNIILQPMIGGGAAWKQWTTAIITAATIIGVNAYSKPKSFLKVIPILLGFVVGYVYGAIVGLVSFKGFVWTDIVIFQNLGKEFGWYGALGSIDWAALGAAILMIVPLSIVTFMEHLGDISANSTVCGKDFMTDPGIDKTIMGDGVATIIAGVIGAPANTTYGENTAVLAMTGNYSTKNIFLAAIFAIGFGIFSIFGNLLSTIPPAVIGGASIVLFGMISASGLRAMVDARVDFNNSKNVIIVSVILAIGLGLGAMSLAGDITGNIAFKVMIAGKVEVSPLAIATFVGILLNLIIPNLREGAFQPSYAYLQGEDGKVKLSDGDTAGNDSSGNDVKGGEEKDDKNIEESNKNSKKTKENKIKEKNND